MYHVKQADIVIIGSGAAGTMSAIYAHRVDPKLKVVVLDKSKMGDLRRSRAGHGPRSTPWPCRPTASPRTWWS